MDKYKQIARKIWDRIRHMHPFVLILGAIGLIAGFVKLTKYLIAIIFAIILAIMIDGCFGGYDRGDVADWLKERGIEDFEISRDYEIIEDEDGYDDHLWTVTLKDGSGLTFYVCDSAHYGGESIVHNLISNYDDVYLSYIFPGFDNSLLSLTETGEYRDGASKVSVTAAYGSRKELEQVYEELKRFGEYADAQDYKFQFKIEFQMKNAIQDKHGYDAEKFSANFWELSEFYHRIDTREEDYQALYDAMWIYYLSGRISYRLEEQLAEFTQEEIVEACQRCGTIHMKNLRWVTSHPIAVFRSGSKEGEGAWEYYDDLDTIDWKISRGMLYELLYCEGFPIGGDSWHYSFTGMDGSLYELSYDFYDEEIGWYYYRDGEKIKGFENFDEKQILELTGLQTNWSDRNLTEPRAEESISLLTVTETDMYSPFDGRQFVNVTARFNGREELEQVYEELAQFNEYMKSREDERFHITITMENALQDKYGYDSPEFVKMFSYLGQCRLYYDNFGDNNQKLHDDILGCYLAGLISFRLEDQLAEFTQDEILEICQEIWRCSATNTHPIAVSRGNNEEGEKIWDYYDDLISVNQELSRGMLYEIMRREGIPVEGDSWHYSFTGIDDSVYEFSYDFHDEHAGWYYYQDGVKTEGYEEFNEDEIRQLTGLEVNRSTWIESRKQKGI